MTDRYANHASSPVAPAAGATDIVPNDTADLGETTRAVYVGIGGHLVVQMLWGQTVTFANVPAGSLLPIRVNRVLTTSTAGAIVGLV